MCTPPAVKAASEKLVDAVPAAAVAAWFLARLIGGTVLPVEHEELWRISAGVVAACAACAAIRSTPLARLWAGITAVTWLIVWSAMLIGAMLGGTDLGRAVSVVGIGMYLLIAVLVAYLFGRRPHPYKLP